MFGRISMKKCLLALLLVAGIVSLHAETHLSGDIRQGSLDASGNPYIVDKDATVPAGKQLSIKEGCVFLFNGFTGLNILGDLSVEGSDQRPVIFTTVNDNDFNPKSQQLPNPFDWNGIIIAKESGSIHLQNFQLRYSVYGIKSQNPVMTLQNGVFRQNGQFHFTMDDKIQYVQDNIPYSYNISSSGEKPAAGEVLEKKKSSKKTATSNTRNIIRYSSLGIGVIGIVAGTIFAIQENSTYTKTQDPKYKSNAALFNEWSNLNSQWETQRNVSIVSFVIGGIGLVGFTATFLF
jgi:hypothetical protein